jgi:hypothetical protein
VSADERTYAAAVIARAQDDSDPPYDMNHELGACLECDAARVRRDFEDPSKATDDVATWWRYAMGL